MKNLFLTIFAGLVLSVTLHAQLYTVTDLGTLGGSDSHAYGINNSGQIVGAANLTGDAVAHATFFSGTGTGNTDLGTLGGTSSIAMGINSSGQIVGSSYRTGYTDNVATLFSGTGTGNTDLGTLGGGSSEAYAINSTGTIVGGASTGAAWHATSFSGTGSGNTDLGGLPVAYTDSTAFDINIHGQIVGTTTTTDGLVHAVQFNGHTDLGTLGGDNGAAAAVNDSGDIVGAAQNASGAWHAVKFSGTGSGNTDLGTLGGTQSAAFAINTASQTVGNSQTTGDAALHGFIINGTGGTMTDLNTLLPGGSPTVSFATQPSGGPGGEGVINDWGQIIVDGSVSGSHTHAILLNPINPNTKTTGEVTNTKFVSGMAYDKFTAVTRSGGLATMADLIGGTTGSGGNGDYGLNRSVYVTFSDRGAAPIASDLVDLTGTSGLLFADTIVLQITYNEAQAIALFGSEANARLGWFDTATSTWKLAITGNTGGTAFFAGNGAYDPLTDFNLGTYGVDTVNNTVWAVVNHNSNFGAVPEPGTYLLFLLGGLPLFLAARRKK